MSKKQFENLIDLLESDNTVFDSLNWARGESDEFIGTGTLDETRIKLLLEPSITRTDHKHYVWLNVAFARQLDDDSFTEDLLGKTSNASRVIGAIANALKSKINQLDKKYEIDAIVFLVKTGEEKRMHVYTRKMARHLMSPWDYRAEIKSLRGLASVVAKRALPPDELNFLKNQLDAHGKTLI